MGQRVITEPCGLPRDPVLHASHAHLATLERACQPRRHERIREPIPLSEHVHVERLERRGTRLPAWNRGVVETAGLEHLEVNREAFARVFG